MKNILRITLSIFLLATVALITVPAAHAQDSSSVVVQTQYPPYPPPPPPAPRYRLRDKADLAVGVTGQYTTPMTSNGPASVWTTDSTGVLASLRFLPVFGSGMEVNYQYTKFSEIYDSPVGGGVFVRTKVPTSFREVTGAFLFHSHNVWGAQPFLSLGGGGIDFVPRVSGAQNQWRATGLAEFGFDIPATRFIGLRLQGRSLFYRAPNFNNAALQSRTWVATVDPSASIYLRW